MSAKGNSGMKELSNEERKIEMRTRESVKQVADEIREMEIEHAYTLDRDGNIIDGSHATGDRDSVKAKNLQDNIFVHNHPWQDRDADVEGGVFSPEDILYCAENNCPAFFAVDGKYTYSLKVQNWTPFHSVDNSQKATMAQSYFSRRLKAQEFAQKYREAFDNAVASSRQWYEHAKTLPQYKNPDGTLNQRALVHDTYEKVFASAKKFFQNNASKYGYIYNEYRK